MHEIIYIQSGTYANHIGQHFWNVQENYFDWETEPEDATERKPPEVNHDVSFREGLAPDGSPTYLPRVLIFDTKDAFGSVSKHRTLYEEGGTSGAQPAALWNGQTASYKQPPRPRPEYQQDLDQEASAPPPKAGSSQPMIPRKTYNPSTWADYTRVYYHPRSIWPVSYNLTGGGERWEEGEEVWQTLRKEEDIWEQDFRLFAEECDLLQGLQLMSSAYDAFASLSVSLLQTFRDDYPKLPALAFVALSGYSDRFNPYDLAERRRLSCESKMLSMLAEAEATVVPLQSPSSWRKGKWASGLAATMDFTSPYHTSALLSAHIESATLPLRLNTNYTSLDSLTSLLNYHTDTPFSHLSGVLPLYDARVTDRLLDFSSHAEPTSLNPLTFSACAAYRGSLLRAERDSLTESLEQALGIREPLLQASYNTLQYPILTSYPPILAKHADHIPVFSMLHTSPKTTSLLDYYAASLQTMVNEGQLAGLGEGLDREDVRALQSAVVNLKEGYMRSDGLDLSDVDSGDDI